MTRPADWWALDLPRDPTPGDPVHVQGGDGAMSGTPSRRPGDRDLAYDGRRIAESAQVSPSRPDGEAILNPYPDMGVRFEAPHEVTRAVPTAEAHMQHGAGGAPQMLIPGSGDLVHRADIIAVAADGSPIPTFVDKWGSVWIKDVDGGVFRFDDVSDVSPGVWNPREFEAERESVLLGIGPVCDAGKLGVGVLTKPVRLHHETAGR